MKLETKLWHKIQRCPVNIDRCFFERIETSTVNGVPDVHWLVDGVSGWTENKAVEKLVNGNIILTQERFTMIQRNWIKDYQKIGGVVFLCIGVYLNDQWEIFWLKDQLAWSFYSATLESLRNMSFHIGEDFPMV